MNLSSVNLSLKFSTALIALESIIIPISFAFLVQRAMPSAPLPKTWLSFRPGLPNRAISTEVLSDSEPNLPIPPTTSSNNVSVDFKRPLLSLSWIPILSRA